MTPSDKKPARVISDGAHPITVFLIGSKIHRWWRLDHVFWVAWMFQRMVRELRRHPELGCLDIRSGGGATVMLWRSREALMRYAHDKTGLHLPAWRRVAKDLALSTSIGLWHEMYEVAPGKHHALYAGMAPAGLARVGQALAAEATDEDSSGLTGAMNSAHV